MDWRKSSRCDSSACVEVAFRKSSRCESSSCVEVGLAGRAYVRDSKLADSPVLSFNPTSWRGFLTGIKSGAYDLKERS